MAPSPVPDIVVARLPIYLRALTYLASQGRTVTSSRDLGETVGVSSAQIRKDLSHFGEYGKQGTGYDIAYLSSQLRRILNLETPWEVALVGMGDLGRALANFGGFQHRGFRLAAAFDSDPSKIGTRVGPLTVEDAATMEEEIRRRGIRVALLTVPAAEAQAATDRLVRAGIRSILCFVPVSISVPDSVKIEHADPVLPLQRMAYYLTDPPG